MNINKSTQFKFLGLLNLFAFSLFKQNYIQLNNNEFFSIKKLKNQAN